jgi:hypothetical protein
MSAATAYAVRQRSSGSPSSGLTFDESGNPVSCGRCLTGRKVTNEASVVADSGDVTWLNCKRMLCPFRIRPRAASAVARRSLRLRAWSGLCLGEWLLALGRPQVCVGSGLLGATSASSFPMGPRSLGIESTGLLLAAGPLALTRLGCTFRRSSGTILPFPVSL